MRKTFFLLALLFVGNVMLTCFYSCKKTDDCHFTTSNYCAVANSMMVQPYTTDTYKELPAGNSVRATNLFLQVEIRGDRRICYSATPSNPFMAQAYACSPPLPKYTLDDNVVEVIIVSDADFNNNYPAGASLNSVFRMPTFNNININSTDSYGNNNTIGENSYYLNQSPEKAGVHTFTITYKFSSGKEIKTSSAPISITL